MGIFTRGFLPCFLPNAMAQHAQPQPQPNAARRFAFLYEGTLLHKAEVRTKPLDGQDHHVPVVCMDVELDNDLRTHMHVERPYAPHERAQAEADAACLKRGTRVAVEAPMLDMRLLVRNAALVTPIDPNTQPQEPALWQA